MLPFFNPRRLLSSSPGLPPDSPAKPLPCQIYRNKGLGEKLDSHTYPDIMDGAADYQWEGWRLCKGEIPYLWSTNDPFVLASAIARQKPADCLSLT